MPLIVACTTAFASAPGLNRLRAGGAAGGWVAGLLGLATAEPLAPLRRVLTEAATDGLRSLAPFQRFQQEEAAAIAPVSYTRAAEFGAAQLRANLPAAYAVTLAAVLGWAVAAGEGFAGQRAGFPDRGWVDMPYAHARAVLKLGDARSALRIVELAYDTLMAARYLDHPALVAAVAAYRTLAGMAGRRLEQTVDDLADDLARSGLTGQLRALAWTLGQVPEAHALRASGQAPSRTLLRGLIRASLERIPTDPLTQYVWLEMKDRPPLDLRGHPFFPLINRRFMQYEPDEYFPVEPSRAYARTLAAWLAGDLGADDVAGYLDVFTQVHEYEETRRVTREAADFSVYLRHAALAYLLAAEYDQFAGGVTAERVRDTWAALLDQAVRMRGRHHLNPHRPDLEGTLNVPLFHLVEMGGDAAWTVAQMERFRAAAMTFPLAVTPPGPVSADEHDLLDALRGAYFTVNHPYLPDHLRRHARNGWPNQRLELSLATGRREYLRIEERLAGLYAELPDAEATPRREPAAGVERIARALGCHRTGLRPPPADGKAAATG